MQKILYITFHEINPVAGVSKKILNQVNSFRKNGLETHLLSLVHRDGQRIAKINDKELMEIKHGILGRIQLTLLYNIILDYISKNNIEFLYIRYAQESNFFYNRFLKRCKKLGSKILLEIPTYPYDGELFGKNILLTLQSIVEKLFRQGLKKYIDFIVTTSVFDTILGCKTIKISNAVNAKELPLVEKTQRKDGYLTLISVATISFWHGLDRIILGLKNYYEKNPPRKVRLIIVGNGDPVTLDEVKSIIDHAHAHSYIEYVGPKFGDELNQLYNKADVAVGCLACHRKNIEEVKSLKNVEYAMRGLPMFYSEKNTDFDGRSYVYKVPSNETPIDIDSLLSFYDNLSLAPEEIRESVSHLTWDAQIKKIITYL